MRVFCRGGLVEAKVYTYTSLRDVVYTLPLGVDADGRILPQLVAKKTEGGQVTAFVRVIG